MSLSDFVYSPLKEDETKLTGWSKSTIDWLLSHKSRVMSTIRGIAKSQGKILYQHDLDDVYSEVLKYMYQSDDYNIDKACERSKSQTIVSLEGYVSTCVKYVTKRYVTDMYKIDNHCVRDTVTDKDDKELSLFDTIADESTIDMVEHMTYKLDDICKSYEYIRYLSGVDVFLIWYIRLKTMQLGKQDKYKDILSILGIQKVDLKHIKDSDSQNDNLMLSIAKAVSIVGPDVALGTLEKYIYGIDKLEAVLELV